MKELTKRMEQSLRFIVERGGAHPGRDGHSTFRALVRRGLIEFEGWGLDDDLQIDGDVELYRPTEAGRHYFDGEKTEIRESDLHGMNIDELHAEIAKLREAIRFMDPRNAVERYDRIADDFWRETGLWPPGRSAAPEMGIPESQREEAQTKWRPFVDRWHERFFDAALGKAT